MRKFKLLLGMLFLLIGSMLLDLLFKRYQSLYMLMEPRIPFGTEIAAYILLMVLLLMFSWWVLIRNQRSFLICSLFILFGAVACFFMTFPGARVLDSMMAFITYKPYQWSKAIAAISDIITSRYGFTRITSAMIFTLGLVRLLPNQTINPEHK